MATSTVLPSLVGGSGYEKKIRYCPNPVHGLAGSGHMLRLPELLPPKTKCRLEPHFSGHCPTPIHKLGAFLEEAREHPAVDILGGIEL